jgi:phthiocerol/phenolphthiocerol synthesis type-I polyketide synthase E
MAYSHNGNEIAIVGIAGRFPGADSVGDLWQNLCDGVEAITALTDEELAARGVPEVLRRDPGFVKAAATLPGAAMFDAGFFGYTPREAELIDPQQRVFLECITEALEDAGRAVPDDDLLVGVFGGAALSSYLVFNLLSNPALITSLDPLQINLGNSNSFLTTRASYKLDLKGPSVNIESACSTSLVAIHFACQSLLNHECDLALGGGVSINLGVQHGYRHVAGSILSPDGVCRPFDADANGIVFGAGAGVVALRRLEDAIADGDSIYAVIRGSAVNNDGALRAGYTAPGVAGQAQVITEALANADVSADTIRYVEAHGTGTSLGDPIEIQALTRAYRASTQARQFCGIGSLKANLGHLDTASGVTGLIKVALALKHRLIPPSIHCDFPNPAIDWAASPFFVSTSLTPLTPGATPLRAAVSSFGMGGTNAHAILEEPPAPTAAPAARTRELLVLSAKSPAALEAATAHLAQHLRHNPGVALADVAFTQQIGRRRFPYRRAVACGSVAEAAAALDVAGSRTSTGHEVRTGRPVVFMFPGQGAQHVGMGARLYAAEPVFRRHVDEGAAILRPLLGVDPRQLLYQTSGPSSGARPSGAAADPGAALDPTGGGPRPAGKAVGGPTPCDSASLIDRTELTQPLLFLIEHALAQLWMSWGIQPETMIGHSVGEYVAACLSGVLPLREALDLVAARGRLMQSLPPGDMLSVNLSEAELARLITPPLAIAGVNGPSLTVASGPAEAIAELERRVLAMNVGARRLRTSHAFHSPLAEPILGAFGDEVRRVRMGEPRISWVSNVTGTWITPEQARDPAYWVRHLRQAVRFADGVATLAARPERVLLEVGPGRALSTFARQCPGFATSGAAFSSLPHPKDATDDDAHALETLGRLWIAGADVDWRALHGGARRRRVPLPTYPFERRRYWIEPGASLLRGVIPAAPAAADHAAPSEDATPASAVALHPRPRLRTAFIAPRTDTERAVAAIWQEILGIAELGVDDNFFELGGHSLLATAVIGRLRENFGLEVPLQVLFDAQTVASMAGVVGALRMSERNADPAVAALIKILGELAAGDPTDA